MSRVRGGCTSRAAGRDAPPHHAPHLLLRIEPAPCRDLIGVVERMRRVFDLGADPSRIGDHLRRSPILAPLVAQVPGLRVPGAWDGFELAVRAILGQQVTVRGATTLAGRIVRKFGKPIEGPAGALTHLFPRAQALAQADIQSIGLPIARAATIRSLAAAVAGGELHLDASLGLEEAVERLCGIAGIGPWTAQYIAMRALGEPDVFAQTDLGIRRALSSGATLLRPGEVLEAAEEWRPWRSYAALYLWAVPKVRAMEKAS